MSVGKYSLPKCSSTEHVEHVWVCERERESEYDVIHSVYHLSASSTYDGRGTLRQRCNFAKCFHWFTICVLWWCVCARASDWVSWHRPFIALHVERCTVDCQAKLVYNQHITWIIHMLSCCTDCIVYRVWHTFSSFPFDVLSGAYVDTSGASIMHVFVFIISLTVHFSYICPQILRLMNC